MRLIPNQQWRLFATMVLLLASSFAYAQDTIDSVWFPADNFTYCNQGHFNVSSVTRYFDVRTSTYRFNFTSTSDINVTNLNPNGTISSASMMQLKFGFQIYQAQPQQFCPDSKDGCPITANQNFTIQRAFNLSNIPLYPLADITAQYTAVAADSTHLICISMAPVGYQHPMWRTIFLWLPIGFTVSAAIISLVASFTVFHDDNETYDMFLFSSNYAMLPGVSRLKTPGFFDLIFYSQFIVTAGLFNIDYPRFHALFTSNFSWSFLLFGNRSWLDRIIRNLFKASSAPIESIASVPGYSLYKRQMDNTTTTSTTTSTINIVGTGMSDFATAVGIDINALFFTLMVSLLFIAGGCLIICFITWAIFYLIGISSDNNDYAIKSQKMWDFTMGVLTRILTLTYLPVLTLSFYQLMLPSSWYITLMAALFLVTPFLFYGFISIKLLQIRPASFIFTELKLLLQYGTLYNTFKDDAFPFFILILVYKSVVAAMIGLFQASGLAQIILVLLAEFSLIVGLFYKMPYADSQVNLFHVVFGFIRLTVFALNIAYLPNIKATAISKQCVGYVQLTIHCLAFFLFLVLQIKNLVIITTGLGDDELDETGKPPARMVIWRKRKYNTRAPQQLSVSSNATLMTGSNRSQTASFYMGANNSNQRNSNRSTIDSKTFGNYYGVANSSTTNILVALKPDEIIQQHRRTTRNGNSLEITAAEPASENMLLQYPSLVKEYRHNLSKPITIDDNNGGGPSNNTRIYKIDNGIVPSSEPLMTKINKFPPPPLPKHLLFDNESSIYSPPHSHPGNRLIHDEK